MKKLIKSKSKTKINYDQFLDHGVMPGLTMRKLMENEKMRDIMGRMIKAELETAKRKD